ncbi:hypothetical protein EAH89_10930 [Roseomonas nepalensis]|uniref:Uncharacterized protein n=1 Tax=Muricoccus nepalensis TaxID=1854500 RepID=A0A502G6G3_9PROT|nr:hypothetical protein EAH89_10930 [Roseomonas nepalensis]
MESLPTLLRIIADLEQIRETLSVALWETSDYPVMLAVYKHIVDQFDAKHVQAARLTAEPMRPIITTSMFVGNTSIREH